MKKNPKKNPKKEKEPAPWQGSDWIAGVRLSTELDLTAPPKKLPRAPLAER